MRHNFAINYKRKWIYLVCVFTFLTFSFSLSALTANIDPDEYIVKAGDAFIFISPILDSHMSLTVFPAGDMSLFPFADSLYVAGLTLTETYKAIHAKIGSDVSQDKLLVHLSRIAPTRFSVMGAVVRSGEYISAEVITLYQALSLAGGMSASASRNISIMRRGKTLSFDLNDFFAAGVTTANPIIMHDDVIMVNLAQNYVSIFTNNDASNHIETIELTKANETIEDILRKMSLKLQASNINAFTVGRGESFLVVERDFVLEPEDSIFVSLQEFFVYVNGYVARPGRVSYNGIGDANFYISQSGGRMPNGSPEKIYLIREDGRKELYKGQKLEPGDIIYVPESWRSLVVSWLIPISTVLSLVSTVILINNSLK